MDASLLSELKEEGCKLIKLSNELKYAYLAAGGRPAGGPEPGASPMPSPRNAAPPAATQLTNYSEPNFANCGPQSGPEHAALPLAGRTPAAPAGGAAGGPPGHHVLHVLYNNYRLILKKYEELSEQRQSFLEGIREYQYRLDNCNHTIQLQKRLLAEASERAAQLNALKAQLGAQRAEIGAREAQLGAREAKLASREAELNHREADVNAKRTEIEEKMAQLEAREASLASKEAELDAREAALASLDAAAKSASGADGPVGAKMMTCNF